MPDPHRQRAEQIQRLLRFALDAMRGVVSERPVLANQDRCILCGWTRADGAKDGICGRSAMGESEAKKYGIAIENVGQHLWFTEMADALRTIERETEHRMWEAAERITVDNVYFAVKEASRTECVCATTPPGVFCYHCSWLANFYEAVEKLRKPTLLDVLRQEMKRLRQRADIQADSPQL